MRRYLALCLAVFSALLLSATWVPAAQLKPFILAETPAGDLAEVVAKTTTALTAHGFTIVGSYSPYPEATVICATNDAILAAAAQAENGGFGAAQRVAVTRVDGKIQVSYMNPAYLGTAYGLGRLAAVAERLDQALGHTMEFGAKGVKEEKLGPGKYHYKMLMPYFKDVVKLNSFAGYQEALAAVEANLAAGKGGTAKVYRIDLPGLEVSVFGVAITQGDGPATGAKDTDKEIMEIIDYQEYRSTAFLPYELLVQGGEVIALHGKYRIAVHFPDTSMIGQHGFTSIMSSPGGIERALAAVAGNE